MGNEESAKIFVGRGRKLKSCRENEEDEEDEEIKKKRLVTIEEK